MKLEIRTGRRLVLPALAALVLATAALVAGTAPKPNMADVNWRLDLKYDTPQPILVDVPGKSQPELFWYMRYTVTNRTGEDRMFAPEIALYTNTGQVVRAGKGVDLTVFAAIKTLVNNPLLQDRISITGKLLQGQDNAKDGVAIFRDFDPKAASFTIFFGGLSGETATVKLPAPIKVTEINAEGKKVTVEKDRILLSKTLALSYRLTVEAANRAYAKAKFVGEKWVMR